MCHGMLTEMQLQKTAKTAMLALTKKGVPICLEKLVSCAMGYSSLWDTEVAVSYL